MSIQWTAINAGKVAICIVSFFKDQTLENIKQVDFCLQNLETVIRTCIRRTGFCVVCYNGSSAGNRANFYPSQIFL